MHLVLQQGLPFRWLDFERVVVAVGSKGFVQGVQGCLVRKWKGVRGAR